MNYNFECCMKYYLKTFQNQGTIAKEELINHLFTIYNTTFIKYNVRITNF